WATHGLQGTRGIYGPAATWFYQLALRLGGGDLAFVCLLKTSICGILLWIASAWLLSLRRPPLSPVILLAAFLSPYLWIYGRDLWDNSFVIPLSALAIASYARFLEAEDDTQRQRLLALSFVFLSLGALIHLMMVPVIAALGVHLIVF